MALCPLACACWWMRHRSDPRSAAAATDARLFPAGYLSLTPLALSAPRPLCLAYSVGFPPPPLLPPLQACDDFRPCTRCMRLGLNESCVNAPSRRPKYPLTGSPSGSPPEEEDADVGDTIRGGGGDVGDMMGGVAGGGGGGGGGGGAYGYPPGPAPRSVSAMAVTARVRVDAGGVGAPAAAAAAGPGRPSVVREPLGGVGGGGDPLRTFSTPLGGGYARRPLLGTLASLDISSALRL